MKSVALIAASLFAVTAFAQAPAKKEEPKTPQPVSEKFHIFKRFKKTRKY